MFRIGDKVACITEFKRVDVNTNKPAGGAYPKVGGIYTITNFHEGFLILKEFGGRKSYDPTKFAPMEDWQRADSLVKELTKDLELQIN